MQRRTQLSNSASDMLDAGGSGSTPVWEYDWKETPGSITVMSVCAFRCFGVGTRVCVRVVVGVRVKVCDWVTLPLKLVQALTLPIVLEAASLPMVLEAASWPLP